MKCTFKKDNGKRCNAYQMDQSQYCYLHNPEVSLEQKKQAQSKGGKSNAIRVHTPLNPVSIAEPEDVVLLLEETVNLVRAGEIDVKVGNCLGVLAGQLLKAIEVSQIKNRVEVIERVLMEDRKSVV